MHGSAGYELKKHQALKRGIFVVQSYSFVNYLKIVTSKLAIGYVSMLGFLQNKLNTTNEMHDPV